MSYRLTPELRQKLKEPLGEMLAEPDWEGNFITVGDQSSFLAAKDEQTPLLMVYDNRIKRKEVSEEKKEAIEAMPGKKILVDNPAGGITDEAELAVRIAMEHSPTKVEVNGEEDLLVLPCLLYAEDGINIYYGQPDSGVVKIMVNPETRERAKKILLSMEEVKQ